ncbi:glycoside hydrolase family 3 C-terminal domain-containing protein [Saccharicrinis fermentans]|uniref:Periplasmic beta-glucosidase n=1 Tax=Saccharicrinis fermentans DSM 9555 = JCM 21142 TaxID=869213 RepID=W7Y5C2_9BACT|nr:glycoside hydrolase family 3 C-terminal domain-containing protein [Saccharicrinis fermentans]GAF02763.1 periplasmic beta-glucosidase precursor [Saccharicrinis fermentans DSM 9555 = JCM 21142]
MKNLFLILLLSVSLVGLAQDSGFKWEDYTLPTEERIEAMIEAMTLEEKASQLLDQSKAIPRLNIPEYNWWNECLHGVARNGRATVFPQAIGLAATFDPQLIQKVSSAISDEARAKFNIAIKNENRSRYAGLTFWTPNINIFRDPRWGRGQETYGEDPFLTSQIGIAFVKGLQGNNEQYLKAAACAKHFAVHSGPEELRHEFDAVVSYRDLYETYLPAFEALVKEADVEIVMGAYNRVLGEPACGSPFLLQEILRQKWGFKGHIVSDCGAISDFHLYHKVTQDAAESAALAINSGVDVNCGNSYHHLVEAVKRGLVLEDTIDVRLRSLLRTRFKLGLFDPVELNPFNKVGEEVICSDEHSAIALEAARKSLVLLTNKNNVLPLNPTIRNLYVTGPQANNSEVLLGNYYGMSNRLVNILEGVTAAVGGGTTINYKQGCLPYRKNVNPMDWTTGEAKASDAIIAVLGITGAMEGEEGEAIASDTKGDRLNPYLPDNQIEFLRKLRKNNEKPIIVVMTGGSPMIIPEVEELADAILWAWYPGQEGGTAVADVIFGKISPSGRLPLTFLKSLDQYPAYEDYSMRGRTYKFMKEDPLFPFGFGLSYTRFKYDNIQTSAARIKKGKTISVTCEVLNVGKRDGEEVVQAYLVQPGAGESAPFKKLVAFKRVNIQKGQSTRVTFEITPDCMKQINNEGKGIIKKGEYTIIIGGSSPVKDMDRLAIAEPVKASFTLR